MSGGNALSGAVSGSVNEFALAYMEKTKGRDWMDTHPDTVQAISTALGAVAGSLTGDHTTGAYTVQMEAKWNRLTKNRKKTRTNNSNKNFPQNRKNLTNFSNCLRQNRSRKKEAQDSCTQKTRTLTTKESPT